MRGSKYRKFRCATIASARPLDFMDTFEVNLRIIFVTLLLLLASCNTCLNASDVPFRGATGGDMQPDPDDDGGAGGDTGATPDDVGNDVRTEPDMCTTEDWCALAGRTCGVFSPPSVCAPASVDCGECGEGGSCEQGSCSCIDGYEPVDGGCEDVDECELELDDCSESEFCINKPGNFICSDCPEGQEQGPDGCVDVDECEEGTDNCDPMVTCTNLDPGFECGECPAGYREETGDRQTCVDVDECDIGADNCDVNATCMNEPGSFGCKCNSGFAGNGLTCTPSGPVVRVTEQTLVLPTGVSTVSAPLPANSVATQVVPFATLFVDYIEAMDDALVDVSIDASLGNVTAQRDGTRGEVSVVVHLVEFASGVQVQSGTFSMSGTSVRPQVNVDLSQTFLVFTNRSTALSRAAAYVSAELRSDEIRFDRATSSGTVAGTWYLVSSPVFSVSHEEVSIGIPSACSSETTSLNAESTFILHSASGGGLTGNNPAFNNVTCTMSNTGTVTCCRTMSNFLTSMDVEVQLVDLGVSGAVQRGTITLDGRLETETLSTVDPAQSMALGGALGAAGLASVESQTSNDDLGRATVRIVGSGSMVEVERSALVGVDTLVQWQVVEWPD